MSDSSDIANLQELLEIQRRTLAVYLRQLVNLGADYAPPGVHNGIADARAEIVRLKTVLQTAGVLVVDVAGDTPIPEELAPSRPAALAKGVNAIDPAAAKALFESLPLDVVPSPAPIPPYSRLQLPRTPQFVGRDADLLALAQLLKAPDSQEVTQGQAVIVTGIGGVGKTQLAAEFVHRYGQFFQGGVFWLSFANPAGIDSEIAACGGAGEMELFTDASSLSQAERVTTVQAEWERDIPRLLIFDACDDVQENSAEDVLAARLPTVGGCRVLVTSRRGQWRKNLGAAVYPLGLLQRAESVALLRRYRDDLSDDDAHAIAEALGDLPLALGMAGNYLETYRGELLGEPKRYLEKLGQGLLTHRSLADQERSVRASFELSFSQIDPAVPVDALAVDALASAAYLAPGEPFSRELLLQTLGDDTDDEEIIIQRADAINRLLALGLLDVADQHMLRIHRLVAAFAQSTIDNDQAQTTVEEVLVEQGTVLIDAGYPAPLQSLLPHLRHAMQLADARGDDLTAELAAVLGRAAELVANYAEARTWYERALAIDQQINGPEAEETALSMTNLANVLDVTGAYTEARSLYERVLAIREKNLPADAPEIGVSLNNLGLVLASLGLLADARSLFERSLAIVEQTPNPDAQETATRLDNLAGVLAQQGELEEAQHLYERALAIRQQVCGLTHPTTAMSLNNLGLVVQDLADLPQARSLFEQALAISEQVYGANHPETATHLSNLASVLQEQGELSQAQELFERTLAIYQQLFGLEHQKTLTTLEDLALVLADQGESAKAQALYEQALPIAQKLFGGESYEAAVDMVSLANVLFNQEQFTAAQPLYEQALAIYEAELDDDDPDLADVRDALAELEQQTKPRQKAAVKKKAKR